jgi:uncharacterized repeat protein (TIGR01451 family)
MGKLFQVRKLRTITGEAEAMSVSTIRTRGLRRRLPPILIGALLLVAGVAAVARAAGEADLAVDKVGSPDPVFTGKRLAYVVTVQNNGPDTATDVNLVDALPITCSEFGCRPVVRLVSVRASQGSCGAEAEGNIPCTLGDIPSGATATVRIVVRAPQEPGSITNSAYVTTTALDPNPSNDRDAVTTTVIVR